MISLGVKGPLKYVTAWDAAVVRLCAGSATWWAPRIAPPKNPGCFGASCTRYLACCARSGRFKRGVFATNRSHAFRRLEDCYYSLVHYPLLNRIRIHLFAHLQNISRDRPARERMTRRGASLPGWVRAGIWPIPSLAGLLCLGQTLSASRSTTRRGTRNNSWKWKTGGGRM